MKNKKGLLIFAIILLAIIIGVFIMRDGRDMNDIQQEQLESAEEAVDSKVDALNMDLDDDFDESEIEDAALAYDTLVNQ